MSRSAVSYPVVLHQAWEKTLSFFGWNWRTLLTGLVGVGGWLVLWYWRGEQPVEDAVIAGLSVVAVMLIAGVALFTWNLWKAPLNIRRRLEKEQDEAKAQLSALLTPQLKVVYRTGDQRYCYTELDGARVYLLSLHNDTMRTIDNIEIYCADILPMAGPSAISVQVQTASSSPPVRLSNGEHIFKELLSVSGQPGGERVAVLLPYRGSRSEALEGGRFVMKIVAIGRDIPAVRMKVRFGRQGRDFFLITEEDN